MSFGHFFLIRIMGAFRFLKLTNKMLLDCYLLITGIYKIFVMPTLHIQYKAHIYSFFLISTYLSPQIHGLVYVYLIISLFIL